MAESERAPVAGVSIGMVFRVLTALVWILWGLKLYQPTFVVSGSAEAGFFFTVGGVVALALACANLPRRWERRLDAVLLLGALVAFGFWTRAAVFASPAYGTDEVAFDQGAAELLLRGQNPYGADLTWTLDAFRVLPSGTTNTLAGGFVHTLSYPPGSFLAYVPILALGIHGQAAIYVDGLFWILGMVALWFALPWPLRTIVPLIASLGIYVDYATGGVTDSLMLPFIVGAFWQWDRFGDPKERSLARWVGPVALGIACTVKQSPWFVMPMLVAAVGIENLTAGRGWRPALRYLSLFSIAFMAPNLPFLIWDPHAWFSGILLPFMEPLVPFGQGFIAISTAFLQGGGSLTAYTLAGAAIMAALGLALIGWYPRLKRLVPVLPLIALLLPTRSLNSYFVYAVPAIVVSMATTRPARSPAWPDLQAWRYVPRLASVLAAFFGVLALGTAVLTPAPLALEAVEEHTTGSLQSVDSLTVIARNRSDSPLEPHFAVALGPYMSSYWLVSQGPSSVPPHGSARYVLLAPNTPSMPGVDQQSVLFALTDRPATVSSARLFPAIAEGTQIRPQAVDKIVANPPEVAFTVQLVDRLNNPIRRAGVVISLGQVLYTAEGLFPGQASINGHAEGASPVSALTDGDGVAHFRARAIQQQPYEVFFQAWLNDPFPHGYSSAVAVHFKVK